MQCRSIDRNSSHETSVRFKDNPRDRARPHGHRSTPPPPSHPPPPSIRRRVAELRYYPLTRARRALSLSLCLRKSVVHSCTSVARHASASKTEILPPPIGPRASAESAAIRTRRSRVELRQSGIAPRVLMGRGRGGRRHRSSVLGAPFDRIIISPEISPPPLSLFIPLHSTGEGGRGGGLVFNLPCRFDRAIPFIE